MTTPADIEAAIDVVDDIARESELLALRDAIAALEALDRLAHAAREARTLVEMQMVALLEQPQIVDGRRWKRSDEYKRRYEHDRIVKMVADRAIADRNGELLDAKAAARNAANLMRKIYVSPSTDAKVGMLRHYLGVGNVLAENLAADEYARTKVEVVQLKEEE